MLVRSYLPSSLMGILLFLLVGGPLIFLLRMSFSEGSPGRPGPFTLDNYRAVFRSSGLIDASTNTLIFASAVSVFSLVIAGFFAWLIERTDARLRNVGWAMMLIPLAMPPVLFSFSWVLLLSPRTGLVNIAARAVLNPLGFDMTEGPFNPYTMPGMIFVETLRTVPTLFLLIVGAFRLTNPALEEAAVMSGATRRTTLRRITLPLLLPALFAAFVFSFIGTLQDFETPLLLGLPGGKFTITTLIYFTAYLTTGTNWGIAAAYSCLFLAVLVPLIMFYLRIVVKGYRSFASVSGRGYRPTRMALGRWRTPATAVFVSFFLVSMVLPMLTVIWASLLPVYQTPSFDLLDKMTFRNYTELLHDGLTIPAAEHTATIALVTVIFTLSVAFTVSWLVIRLRAKGRSFLDSLAFLPNAIPSVALGVAIVVFYLNPAVRWVHIYGSNLLLIIAFAGHFLAYVTRLSNSAMVQLDDELEEASWVSGKGKLTTLFRITGKLLLPSILASAVWVTMRAFGNLTLPLLVGNPQSETLSMRMYSLWTAQADIPSAAAIGVSLMLFLTALALLARKAITRQAME